MREILFRGYSTAERMWIYGDLSHTTDKIVHISNENCFIGVKPETVGQYTGLTDKNGKQIFEGDIIRCSVWYEAGCYPHTKTKEIEVRIPEIYTIHIDDIDGNVEVIGNIHDNPELIGGDKE